MNQEILQTLQEIRGLLYIFLYAGCFVLIIYVTNYIAISVFRIKKVTEVNFNDVSQVLMDQGSLPELIKHCEEKLKKYPNHSYATWWLAKAKYQIGQKKEAKLLFERLQEIEPSWKKEYIDPYMKEQIGEMT